MLEKAEKIDGELCQECSLRDAWKSRIRKLASGVFVKFYMFFKCKNTRANSFYHCFTILRSHKCGIIFTRFLTFIWWRKIAMSFLLLMANWFYKTMSPCLWCQIALVIPWVHSCGVKYWLAYARPRLLASYSSLYTTSIVVALSTSRDLESRES